MIPRRIPCPHCETKMAVVVRQKAEGMVQYLSVRCACGVFISVAGHSESDEKAAQEMALEQLRWKWKEMKIAHDIQTHKEKKAI